MNGNDPDGNRFLNYVRRFVRHARESYQERGLAGLEETIGITKHIVTQTILDNTLYAYRRRGSQNVYDREWDVLVLLDCARVDMMREVKDAYSYINDVGEHVSPGTHSREWMEYTFTDTYANEMEETLHVTANTASNRALYEDDFLHLEEVWRDGWDKEHKTILPRTVTNRAIALYRDLNPERAIIHYMQPHLPFIPYPEVGATQVSGPGIAGNYGKSAPELAKEYSREEMWEFFMGNLRYVLNDLEILLSNLDADRVVISSDHGEAMGENGLWGHYRGSKLDCLRRVPWCVTTAHDSGDFEPDLDFLEPDSTGDGLTVEQKLRHLGYKT